MDFIYNEQTIIAMYFELIVIIIAVIMLFLIFNRYLSKRNKLTLILFTSFFFLTLSVVFSYLSKVFWLEYYYDRELILSDPLFGLKARIIDYRIAYVCSVISGYLTFLFQGMVFDKTISKIQHLFFSVAAGIIIIPALAVYDMSDSFWNTMVAIFTMLYVVSVYFIFLIKSIKLYSRLKLEQSLEQDAIKSLIYMSVFFFLIYICAALNQVMYLYTSEGYNFPYYLMWCFGIAAFISAYFGYLKPRSNPN